MENAFCEKVKLKSLSTVQMVVPRIRDAEEKTSGKIRKVVLFTDTVFCWESLIRRKVADQKPRKHGEQD